MFSVILVFLDVIHLYIVEIFKQNNISIVLVKRKNTIFHFIQNIDGSYIQIRVIRSHRPLLGVFKLVFSTINNEHNI